MNTLSKLIAKIHKTVVAGIGPLEFTALACLDIKQVIRAKAAHSNFCNQFKRGNFVIASNNFMKTCMLIMAIALLPMYSSAQTADAGKGSTKIEIESIKYGARPDNLIPVTNKIMDMLKSGVKIKVSSSIVVADPAPGERKYVHIVFLMNGNRTSIKFMDGETFDLSLLQKRLSEVAGQKIEIVTKAAITSSKPVSGQNQQPGKFNPGEFKASVNQAVEMVSMESTDLKVNGIQMLAYSKAFKAISDNPEVEKLMGVDNEWYLNISKMLGEMSKYKLEMEISKERNLTERFDAAKKTYAELCRKFKYLMDHPQKLQKK